MLSVYSLGECRIREGCTEPREGDSTASIDNSELKVHISAPQPDAQIEIAGYTNLETKPSDGNLEMIGVNLDQGTDGPPPFTMQVLLVLAGMMGAVAIVVLLKARK